MKNFTYKNPSSVEEAVGFLMEPDTVAMGGGTDLLGVLKDGLLPEYPRQVVNLKGIPGLNRIEEREDGLHITARVNTARGVACRAVAETLPPYVRPAEPTLEDAYLYLISGEGEA